MKHYEQEISQFVDSELPAIVQKELFAHLTECEECRNALSDFMEMKRELETYYENIEIDLSGGINLPVEVKVGKRRNIYKPLFYLSAAASIILGLLFLIKLSNVNKLESQYSSIKEKYSWLAIMYKGVQSDNLKIQSPENNSSISRKTKIQNADNKIPVNKNNKENPSKNKTVFLAVNKIIKHNSNPAIKNKLLKSVGRLQEIKVVQVTKNDFLTPQIIGN